MAGRTIQTTSHLPEWLEVRDDAFWLRLVVQPGAKRTEVVGVYDHCLKVKISAPPVDGAANDEVTGFFSKLLGLKNKQVVLVHGMTSRRKTLEVSGISPIQAWHILSATLLSVEKGKVDSGLL